MIEDLKKEIIAIRNLVEITAWALCRFIEITKVDESVKSVKKDILGSLSEALRKHHDHQSKAIRKAQAAYNGK